MTNINRKKALILLSVAALAVMLSGLYITAYAAGNGEENTAMPELNGWRALARRGLGRGGERHGFVEISADYKANVLEIAESDEDVQGLLDNGYTVLGVRPIIKPIVDANGDVTIKATNAIVMLENEDTAGHAAVWVDLDAGSVTKIVILTRTIIEKIPEISLLGCCEFSGTH